MRSSWSRAIYYDLVPEKHGPVAQRLEQGTHNPLVPGSNPGGPKFRFRFSIFDLRLSNRATSRALQFSHYRDYNAKCAHSGGSVRELSGRFCRRERLFHRCGLLRADDSGADVRKKPGISRPSSQL